MKKTITALSLGLGISLLGSTGAFAYTVEEGDTMNKIAQKNGTTLGTLIKLNPQIENPNVIFPNQFVKTPSETTSQPSPVVTPNAPIGTTGKVNVTSNDRALLERLVQAEAGGEPYAGKVAVATVVLNRVLDNQFPNDIHDVIYQKSQFSPIADGSINNTPSEESRKAVQEAIEYVNSGEPRGALFFYNYHTVHNAYLDAKPTVAVIGNHIFKK